MENSGILLKQEIISETTSKGWTWMYHPVGCLWIFSQHRFPDDVHGNLSLTIGLVMGTSKPVHKLSVALMLIAPKPMVSSMPVFHFVSPQPKARKSFLTGWYLINPVSFVGVPAKVVPSVTEAVCAAMLIMSFPKVSTPVRVWEVTTTGMVLVITLSLAEADPD